MQIISGQTFNFSSNGSAQLGLREEFQVTSATAVIEGLDVESPTEMTTTWMVISIAK